LNILIRSKIKIREFFTQPLPANVCLAMGKIPPCRICWGCVAIIAVLVAYYVMTEILFAIDY